MSCKGVPHSLNARCTTVSCRWCRRRWRVSGSSYARPAGNTHCQPHSRPAFGYFSPSAPGSATHPAPAATSRSCCVRTSARCRSNTAFARSGSIVWRSRSHFVPREHHRHSARTLRSHQRVQPPNGHVQHVAIQEHDRCERLILGRRADVGVHRQAREKARDVSCTQLARMTRATETNEATLEPCFTIVRRDRKRRTQKTRPNAGQRCTVSPYTDRTRPHQPSQRSTAEAYAAPRRSAPEP